MIAFLHEHGIELDGARAVVIGRSDIVGKPMAHLLLQANATVTICHSHTNDFARHTLDADVLVVAVGVPAIVSPDMVKTGAASSIDVGINRTDDGLVGDVDPAVRRRRRVSDAGAGRRRADDDRLPAPERDSLRPVPAGRACISGLKQC